MVLLAGCVPPEHRIEALAEAGWLGEACHAAIGVQAPPEALLRAHLAGQPQVVGHVTPADAFPRAPAYGEDILLMSLVFDETAGPAPFRKVHLTPVIAATGDTWLGCSLAECDEAWVRDRLGLPPRPTDPPAGHPWRNALGIFALGGAMLWDIAMSPVRAMEALGDGPVDRSASGWVVEHWLSGSAPMVEDVTLPDSPLRATHVVEHGSCATDGACLDAWVGRPEFGGPAPEQDVLRISWDWQHEACTVWATWELPLGTEGTLATRLEALLAEPVRLSDHPVVGWGVTDAP